MTEQKQSRFNEPFMSIRGVQMGMMITMMTAMMAGSESDYSMMSRMKWLSDLGLRESLAIFQGDIMWDRSEGTGKFNLNSLIRSST